MNLLFLFQVDTVSTNVIRENSNKFMDIDPTGIGMTAIGMAIVFISLLLLYVVFMNITRVLNFNFKKTAKEAEQKEKPKIITGEINAAIAAALYLYLKEKHDHESAVLTINKVSRTYSPWSSKIYGLRQYPG